ncbi:ABC transporter substrate-binding protein [Thermococcus thioreducens]|uniref:ABC transporter substrate-binding protein n=1 Tax=Thermococcus thioreducens TaxID=277988 RepID=A0A0Q2M4S8_9EURY|nr:ABC transporter substrate-binding protein [Thermococcus thioreducens]ASJ13031.1 ABC transporter substrate-binding protein [Thermococcus thioreducens]KQH82922.1 ABC transporter substrate-binding protein [Thermococcus thioreducens]SEV82095.1 carbohydrate ABC transporter substrate-binding protein, CUT1 family [Thermococcus thioreducens]
MKRLFGLLLAGIVVFAVVASGCISPGGETKVTVTFLSTQLNPPEERAFVQEELLKGFTDETGIDVNFVPIAYTDLITRLEGEQQTGKVTIDVIGDLHGGLDYMAAKGWLEDLGGMPKLEGRTFINTLEKYSYIRGQKVYVPWMSATYVMVVNKDAFKYLPEGLTEEDVMKGTEKWTYDALLQWAKNLKEATGQPQLGFPAGPKGLWHRFLHGYIYPSYTGYQAKKFNSPEAVEMWNYMKGLWPYVHPSSTVWDAMADPLLKGEVMIAWDHTARIKNAIETKPDQFVVVPVPRGPKGRGFIVVIAGLAIPKNAPNKEEAWKLIDYLTRPETQVKVLEKVGFFPTVEEASGKLPEGPLKILAEGVQAQASTEDALIAIIPNLGEKGGQFTSLYREAFERIVLKNEDPQAVLNELGPQMEQIFQEVGIPMP